MILLALSVISLLGYASGETYTLDEEAEFEKGDYDDIMWDTAEEGITIGPEMSYYSRWPLMTIGVGPGGSFDSTAVGDPCVLYANNSFYLYYTAWDGSTNSIGVARYVYGGTINKISTPVLEVGGGTDYDGGAVMDPYVIYEDGLFKMYYTAVSATDAYSIAYATSTDGYTWTKYNKNPILETPTSGWGSLLIKDPCVMKMEDRSYYMYVTGIQTADKATIGMATSTNGYQFNWHTSNPIVKGGRTGDFGTQEALDCSVIRDDPGFRMYFTGRNTTGEKYQIGRAWSFDGIDWDLDPEVYIPMHMTWDSTQTQSPHAFYIDGEISIIYNGQDSGGADRLLWGMVREWYVDDHDEPVLSAGATYDSLYLTDPFVLERRQSSFVMFYEARGTGTVTKSICRAHASSLWGPWSSSGVVLERGAATSWDDDYIGKPSCVRVGEIYYLYYSGDGGGATKTGIGVARSNVVSSFTKEPSPVLTNGSNPFDWDHAGVSQPWVIRLGDTFHMWYTGWSSDNDVYIGHATSQDGLNWTKDPNNPVVGPGFYQGFFETIWIDSPVVIYEDGKFTMFISAGLTTNTNQRIVSFSSWDGTNWTLDEHMPVLVQGESGRWDDTGIWAGSVFVDNGMRHMYYAGNTGGGLQRIGHAILGGTRGYYTSPVIDAGSLWPVEWSSLEWDASLGLGASVRFRVATNDGGSIWDFDGPDGTSDTYFTTPGQAIHQYQTGRFMRIRAYLETDNESIGMPVVHSISVHFQQRPSPSPPVVTLTSPNGGEDWMKTKQYPVTWTAVGNFATIPVDLYYSTNNGSTWSNLALNRANTGYYMWTVPSTETSGAMVRIVVEDIDGVITEDTSDATFAIDPPPPKSGEFFVPASGDTMAPGIDEASWTVYDPWGLVERPLTLELTTDDGGTWTTLADGLALTDSHEWEVPALASSSDVCRLRLSVLDWLGGISVIESGEFMIDVSPPSSSMDEPGSLIVGVQVTIFATCIDDLGVRDVEFHIEGKDGTRTYDMEMGEDGEWSVVYVPERGDGSLWVSASDGVHTTSSEHVDVRVKVVSEGKGGGASLVFLLSAATAMAALVTIVVVLRGRRD